MKKEADAAAAAAKKAEVAGSADGTAPAAESTKKAATGTKKKTKKKKKKVAVKKKAAKPKPSFTLRKEQPLERRLAELSVMQVSTPRGPATPRPSPRGFQVDRPGSPLELSRSFSKRQAPGTSLTPRQFAPSPLRRADSKSFFDHDQAVVRVRVWVVMHCVLGWRVVDSLVVVWFACAWVVCCWVGATCVCVCAS